MKTPSLKFYSLGVITKDKLPVEDTVSVLPVEHISDLQGDPESNITTHGEVDAHNTITAVWLSTTDSRTSPPDVVAGEEVLLYRYADTAVTYWVTKHQNLKLRKLEHVKHTFSNTPKEDEDATVDKSYFFEVSTRDKHIILQTSNNDKEAAKYIIKLDTKNGILTIQDDLDNHIVLDSTSRSIDITTSTVTMNIDQLNVHGDAHFTKTMLIEGTTTVNSDTAINASTTISESLSVANTVSAGGMSSSGSVSAGGAVTASGPISSSTSVSAPNI